MMDIKNEMARRDFFKTASAGVAAAATMLSPRDAVRAQEALQKAALERIAANSYPILPFFKRRQNPTVPPPPSGDNANNPAGRGAGGGGGRGGGRGGGAAAAEALAENPNAKAPLAVAEAAAAARKANLTPAQMKEKYGEITML